MTDNVLVVNKIKKYFPTKNKTKFVKAIDDVSFEIKPNEVVGLVGESGSGKSTIAYSIVGMHKLTAGSIIFNEQDISLPSSHRSLDLKKEVQIVFQDPGTSLNPKRSVGDIIKMPLKVHNIVPRNKIDERVRELLDLVGLPQEIAYKYPRSLGGGERQMVAIARALTTNPKLVVLDEPTSSLDVSIQAKIINMLMDIRKQFNMSYLFITHDMSLMRNISDRIAIMYLGRIMEIARTKELFQKPNHPYSQMLLSSIPVVLKIEEKLKPHKVKATGEIPSPVDLPTGCRFQTRCQKVFDRCYEEEPVLIEISPNHLSCCHLNT